MWGGHRNGDIPTGSLEYVGVGLLSGERQYLHPAAARAWRALVEAVRARTGRTLLITEGYRTRKLQQHYWDTLPYPMAAWPGTSTHGWALAVDMGNYTGAELKAVRELAEGLGWSLATGDRVREPWHLEYVGSLITQAADTVTPIRPVTPADTEEDDDMPLPRYRQVFYNRPGTTPLRALYSFDSGFFHQWTASTATLANTYAKDYDTGNAAEVSPSMFNEIRRACNARAATPLANIEVTIAEAD